MKFFNFGEIFGGQRQTTQPQAKPQGQSVYGRLQSNQRTTQGQLDKLNR